MFCVAVNALDGYDVFIMGYALPYLPAELASPVDKGYLLSSALVGLGVGAMFLARFADIYPAPRVHRRPPPELPQGCSGRRWRRGPAHLAVLHRLAVGVIGTVCIVTCREMAPASSGAWRSAW
ncbi:hypothetical protein HBB16_09705 [Pseudonocardia sp. MCCB 268]|nr:hypothetical protein [Pseudonocardia cytotoxica]